MPKAILELEMPESCRTCPIKRYLHYGWVEHICGITGEQCQEVGRRPDCPLKLVDVDALERKKPKKVVSMETTNKFKNPYGYHPAYGHCPICGRIYWDKCHVGNYCDSCGQRLEVERATVEIVKKGLPKLLEKAVATDAKEVNHEPF